ncbi:MAG: hypothetical protein ACYC6Y_17185 [Thermoguttaceae bacterium]
MNQSMPILPGSGRFAGLGAIVILGAVFLLGCGGSESTAPDAAPSAEAPASDADASPAPAADAAPASEPAEPSPEKPAETPAAKDAEAAAPAAEAAPKPAEAAPPAAAAKKAPEAKAAAKAPESPATPPPAADSAQQAGSRPNDVGAWKDDDFRSAKEQRDPRLLDAVAYLGENNSGDARAALLLGQLLTTPEDPEPEPKPEPKVEKKPEPKKSEYDEYSGGMGDGYAPPSEEDMGYEGGMPSEMDGYAPPADEYMSDEYMSPDGSGPGQRKTEVKSPLSASYVSLTGGIVRALGANGTREAREVLEQLLGGKLPTANQRAAVGAVLRTLVDYPCPENDALLRKVLTAPEAYRPTTESLTASLKESLSAAAASAEKPEESEQPKQDEESAEGGPPTQPGEKKPDIDTLVAASLAGSVTAEDIRDTTLPLIEKSASMRLRYDLAAYLIGSPSENLGPRLQELVTATHPLNVQAQIGLYRYPKTPPEMRDSFERYFTSYASCALGRILGVSSDTEAELQEVAAPGQPGIAPAQPQRWSGFGDSTKKPESAGQTPGSGGYPQEPSMEEPGYAPPDETLAPRPAADSPGGARPPAETGQDMYQGPGAEGSDQGGGSKPPTGPGKADAMSIRQFEEVATADPNLPYELAQQLWGNELGSTLAARMNTLPTLADGAQLIMLAGHIPTDAMRAQLLRTLQAHWMDGPGAFASAGVVTEIGIIDPGFIAIVKSLPRREPPARTAKVEPSKEQDAQYAWMQTSYGTVRGFCVKLQKAADNQKVNAAELVATLPFHPHSADTITHAYAMDWQKTVGSRLAGAPVDPMRIYYLRFEETGPYNKVQGAYKRIVPSGTERLVKNGLWIDGTKAGPEPGRRTTMDVIIDRTEYKADRKVGEAEPMIIQVLYVEINDPNPPKAAEPAAAG